MFRISLEVVTPLIVPPVILAVPLTRFRLFRSAALISVPPETVTTLAVPSVRSAVAPVATVKFPSVALAVKVPAVTFERPVTMAEPLRLVMLLESIEANVPPEAVKLPALMVAPIVPAEMLAVPAAPTVRLPMFWLESRVPPVTLARPSTCPPEILEVPAVTVSVVRFPPVRFKVASDEAAVTTPPEMLATPPVSTFSEVILAALSSVPATSVTLAEPAVRLAFAPVATVTLPRVALAVKVPAVTFERPVTVAPFRLVMLLEAIEAKVPPVAFRLPALVVAPIVPAEILAVPAAPTVRLVRLAALISVPPVTLADAPEPAVMLVVPVVTLTEPAETVTFPRSMAVIKAPADETLPVRLPPVRLAVPAVPTVRSFRMALAVNVLPVTLARPVTFAVPPVMFVTPAVRIEPISPSVILAAPAAPTVRLPRLTFESSVPAVTLALPVNVPPERLDVLPFTIRPLSVPFV